jgi:hypothetical protein
MYISNIIVITFFVFVCNFEAQIEGPGSSLPSSQGPDLPACGQQRLSSHCILFSFLKVPVSGILASAQDVEVEAVGIFSDALKQLFWAYLIKISGLDRDRASDQTPKQDWSGTSPISTVDSQL